MKNKRKAQYLEYEKIYEGDIFSFEKKISQKDVGTFAELTGDYNPLHTNLSFGRKSQFGKNIVHGLLAGSFFSTLVGMYCPGEKSLYMAQSYFFREPLFVGDRIKIKGTVVAKNDSIKLITLKTEVWKKNKIAINGEAKVSFLE